MANSRLYINSISSQVLGVLANLKRDIKNHNSLHRAHLLALQSSRSDGFLERIVSQDKQWDQDTCLLLSTGCYSEPGAIIGTVKQALDLFDFKSVMLTAQFANLELFYRHLSLKSQFDSRSILHFGLAASLACWELGQALNVCIEKACLLALFESSGVPILACFNPQKFQEINKICAMSGAPALVVERDIFGFDSLDVRRVMLENYGFSTDLEDELRLPLFQMSPEAQILAISYAVAQGLGINSPRRCVELEIDEGVIQSIGISPQIMEATLMRASYATRILSTLFSH